MQTAKSRTPTLDVRRQFLALAVAVAAATALAPHPAKAQIFQYRATVADGLVDRSGAVNANGLVWQCAGNNCTISGPWAVPGVHACANLAQLVGRIASYGHPGRMLNTTELAQCNANMATDGPRATPVNPNPVVVAVPAVPIAQPIRVVRANDSLRYTGQRFIGARTMTTRTLTPIF
ncbi:MAG: CC_3452 family protein [Casimicrobium sp.]